MKIVFHDPKAELVGLVQDVPQKMQMTHGPLDFDFDPKDDLAVILAVEGPGLSDVITSFRMRGARNPILVIRSRRDSEHAADMLFAGADDDMVAPVKWEEIVARAEAVLRRVKGGPQDGVGNGSVVAFEDGRPAKVAGRTLDLSPTENLVLLHLLRNSGRYVTRRVIHDFIYGLVQDAPGEQVIDVHICNIRRKIRAIGAEGAARVETGRGLGYRIG